MQKQTSKSRGYKNFTVQTFVYTDPIDIQLNSFV